MTKNEVIEQTDWTLDWGWKTTVTEGSRAIFICGLGISIATLMSGILPLTIPFMFPTIALGIIGVIICHIYYANKYLLHPSYSRLNSSRKLLIRWTSRIAFILLILMVYTPATLFSLIISPLSFTIFVTLQKTMIDAQLVRQQNNIPLNLMERFAIGGLLTLSLMILTGVLLLATALGLTVEWVIDYFNLFPSNGPT